MQSNSSNKKEEARKLVIESLGDLKDVISDINAIAVKNELLADKTRKYEFHILDLSCLCDELIGLLEDEKQ